MCFLASVNFPQIMMIDLGSARRKVPMEIHVNATIICYMTPEERRQLLQGFYERNGLGESHNGRTSKPVALSGLCVLYILCITVYSLCQSLINQPDTLTQLQQPIFKYNFRMHIYTFNWKVSIKMLNYRVHKELLQNKNKLINTQEKNVIHKSR